MNVNKITSYYSLANEGITDEIVINKSRFIGYAKSTLDESDALEYIDSIRRLHPECSCICYGYICGLTGLIHRFHDGHEPVGGIPILEAIKGNDLVATTCVVVRYYGGVKLGKGGLARAFSSSAAQAIRRAKPSLFEIGHIYSISYDYQYNDKIVYMMDKYDYTLLSTDYSYNITINVQIKDKNYDEFLSRLNVITLDKQNIKQQNKLYVV